MVDVLRNGGLRAVAHRQTPLFFLDGNCYLTCQAERAGIFMTSAELDRIAGVECLDLCGAYRLNKHTGWAERVMQFSTHTCILSHYEFNASFICCECRKSYLSYMPL